MSKLFSFIRLTNAEDWKRETYEGLKSSVTFPEMFILPLPVKNKLTNKTQPFFHFYHGFFSNSFTLFFCRSSFSLASTNVISVGISSENIPWPDRHP